jgi:HSP20 family protein
MFFSWQAPDPQSLFNRLQDEMRDVVERVWHTGVSTRPFDGQSWGPQVDLYEHNDRYTVFLEVPGVKPNEIDVSYVGNSVTVRGRKEAPLETSEQVRLARGERRYGAFCRSIELPGDVDVGRTSAKFHAGVLELTIPKSELSRPRSVKIQVDEG